MDGQWRHRLFSFPIGLSGYWLHTGSRTGACVPTWSTHVTPYKMADGKSAWGPERNLNLSVDGLREGRPPGRRGRHCSFETLEVRPEKSVGTNWVAPFREVVVVTRTCQRKRRPQETRVRACLEILRHLESTDETNLEEEPKLGGVGSSQG